MAGSIVWFRDDLRLDDHPALRAAVDRGGPVFCVYLHDTSRHDPWTPGAASRWWLHHSLTELAVSLASVGSRLIVRSGPCFADMLSSLIDQTGADAVYATQRVSPCSVASEGEIVERVMTHGADFHWSAPNLLFPVDRLLTGSGTPYRVYTPFSKQCFSRAEEIKPLPATRKIPRPKRWPESDAIDKLDLLPRRDWAAAFPETWAPGEAGARDRLKRFLKQGADAYQEERDRPDHEGTSRLSPHLHFGEISPRRVWHAIAEARLQRRGQVRKHLEGFQRQLIWREFAHHVLHHYPDTTDAPLHEKFAQFPWIDADEDLTAWQRGQTGYPLVDAGMRQLWVTGWMHNRVRMIVGSLLTKHLLIDWRHGARWFWDTLVDADLANNTLGWQWIAGCGADAAPYFRVFNPVIQGERFDPQGDYVRRWVPELAGMPSRWIHQPWAAAADVLDEAEVRLGDNYPRPIIEHKAGRERALAAYATVKRSA